ncbi:MAG: hypothetical protein AAGL24_18415 [Pseudomonadota bacterium]
MIARLQALLNRDVTASVMSQVLVSGLNFAIGVLAARLLGVEDFGLFSLILLMASFTTNIEAHFLTLPMMTLAGARTRRSPAYFATIQRLGLMTGCVSALLIAGFVFALFALRGETADMALIAAAAFLTFSQNIQAHVRRVLFARIRPRQAVALDFARLVLMALAVGLILAAGVTPDVPGTLFVLGLAALVPALPFLWSGARHAVRPRLVRVVLARHWPIASWLLLMLLVAIGQEQALWMIAGVEFGDAAIGGLRAGQYLLGTTHFLIYALENFMPRTAAQEMRKDDVSGLLRYLGTQTLFVGTASLALILPLAVFAGPVLGLVFGPDFAAYADLTRIFAAVYAVTIVRMVWLYYLRVVERTRDVFVSYVISSLTAIALVYPLIDRFGVGGIPVTMLVAQTVLLAAIGAHIARHAIAQMPRNRTAVPGRVA